MAYFFTLLYLLTAYITPYILFGPLAEFHIEVIVVLLALVTSVPNLGGSGLGRAPQVIALAGISLCIFVSLLQTGWLGGAAGALYTFLQPVFAFVLVAVNFKKRRHLQWLVLLFGLGSIFFMVEGTRDLMNNVWPSPYLFGSAGALQRLRGLGTVNDPNDFSQMLVSLIPAVFLWKQKSFFLNILLIGVPIAILITGMYLTHSRGAMLALGVVVLLAGWRKLGMIPAVILAGGLLAGLFAGGWSGGRDVSMDAGADRLDLWYDGWLTIKAHPLFGIGLDQFSQTFGITAHNSVVICASELGIVGLYFWVLFLLSTVRRAIGLGKPTGKDAAAEEVAEEALFPWETKVAKPVGIAAKPGAAGVLLRGKALLLGAPEEDGAAQEDTGEMARILFLSLAGLLTAGWFLSRALSMWLFMYCGLVYAVSRMKGQKAAAVEDPLPFLMRWAGAVTVGLLMVLYVILRARNI